MENKTSIFKKISLYLDDEALKVQMQSDKNKSNTATVQNDGLRIITTERHVFGATLIRCQIESERKQTIQLRTASPLCCLFVSFLDEIVFRFNGTAHGTHPYHFNFVKVPANTYELELQDSSQYDLVMILYSSDLLAGASGGHPQLTRFLKSQDPDSVFPLYPWFIPAGLDLLITVHEMFLPWDQQLVQFKTENLVLNALHLVLRPLEQSLPGAFRNLPQEQMNIVYSFVEHVLSILDNKENQITDHTNIGEIIDIINTNRLDLARNFKAMFGESPYHFFNAIRMRKALNLLTECPQMPLTEVANAVGYKSTKTFKKAFIPVYGETCWSCIRPARKRTQRINTN